MLEKMLASGVIQPSMSSWAAAPVLVRKKDGKVRWCIDYRALNNVTVKDVFPLPLMSECIDSLEGNVWFSKLDANAAYWQIPVHKDSKAKTAFRTRHGLYEFNKLPFGLVNSPSLYSRALSLVLRGLSWKSVLAYLDDICVLGKSVDDHLTNLKHVLKRFRQYGLKLKPTKCDLFQTEIEFLGRKVGKEGVAMTSESIKIVQNWSPPTSIKGIERFLGLINYHRSFIKDIAQLAEPLYRLLKKKAFEWGEEQQSAFEELKMRLVSPPVLSVPSTAGIFILDTDASDKAIGAELLQVQDGQERVIAYGSFALTPHQRRYCTTRKELLAVVRFTNQFRHYLLGRKFIVRTDHNSLVWLMNFKQIEGQLARWIEELGQFSMTIEHRPGKKHANADALSRIPDSELCQHYESDRNLSSLPCGGCTYCQRAQQRWSAFSEEVDNVIPLSQTKPTVRRIKPNLKPIKSYSAGLDIILNTTPIDSVCQITGSELNFSDDEIKQFQSQDPQTRFVRGWLLDKLEPSKAELMLAGQPEKFFWLNRNLFYINNGLLYKRGEDRDFLIVPPQLKEEIMKLCHNLPSSGHQGIDRTKKRILTTYFWYQISKDVKRFVLGCHVCNQNKSANRKSKFPLVQYHAGVPMEKVHIDFIGPLPKTPRGNEHILVIVDQFTKWLECIPLPSQSAETTARAAVNEFFSRFGYPLQLVSDQGRNFESTLFKTMCKLLHIHKVRTTAYRPSANGQAERMNRTLMAAIRSFIDPKQTNWDDYIPLIASAIRSSVNRHTGFTPNKMMLGREVMTPPELLVPGAKSLETLPDEHVNELRENLEKCFATARKTLQAELKRTKRDFDLNAKKHSFRRGDAVYYLDKSAEKGKCSKLKPIWIGPAIIMTALTPYTYRVKFKNKDLKVINHDSLKVCSDRELPSWITREQIHIRDGTDIPYCLCGLPDDGDLMIRCDVCFEWYHGRCVNLTPTHA